MFVTLNYRNLVNNKKTVPYGTPVLTDHGKAVERVFDHYCRTVGYKCRMGFYEVPEEELEFIPAKWKELIVYSDDEFELYEATH